MKMKTAIMKERVRRMENFLREEKKDIILTENTMKQMQREIDRLKDEAYKDEALQKANETIELLRKQFDKSFTISEEEYEAIENWKNDHELNHHGGNGAGGAYSGRYTYCFTPTGFGTVGTIKCTCGAEFTFSEIQLTRGGKTSRYDNPENAIQPKRFAKNGKSI